MRNNRAREDRERRPEPRPFPAYKAPDPEPGRPKVRLISCPNAWCNQSFYHEYVDDAGRVTGYCEACGTEKTPPRIGLVRVGDEAGEHHDKDEPDR